jgi:hypothetical protein
MSTQAQHSPGEWEYDESTGQVDVPDGTICVGITWRPNGYLIEAAPDLLAALEAASVVIPARIHASLPDDECSGDCGSEDDCNDPTWGDYRRARAAIDAAIAKARGTEATR